MGIKVEWGRAWTAVTRVSRRSARCWHERRLMATEITFPRRALEPSCQGHSAPLHQPFCVNLGKIHHRTSVRQWSLLFLFLKQIQENDSWSPPGGTWAPVYHITSQVKINHLNEKKKSNVKILVAANWKNGRWRRFKWRCARVRCRVPVKWRLVNERGRPMAFKECWCCPVKHSPTAQDIQLPRTEIIFYSISWIILRKLFWNKIHSKESNQMNVPIW